MLVFFLASCGSVPRSAAPPAPARPHVAPPQVTRALIEDLVAGRARWGELVDPVRGVTFVEYTSMDSDPGIVKASSHLCGETAANALAARHDGWAQAIHFDEIFQCTNAPGPPTCELGTVGEFAGTTRLIFAADGATLRLDTVEDVNSAYKPADETAVLAQLRARQRDARCR
jgi:hypothetical protein